MDEKSPVPVKSEYELMRMFCIVSSYAALGVDVAKVRDAPVRCSS